MPDDREKNRVVIAQRDRDVRSTKTPPHGSPAAQALAHVPAFDQTEWDPKTDPNATDFEKLQHRAQKAAANSELAVSGTHQLRLEVNGRFDNVNARIDGVTSELSDFRAETKGAIGELSGEVRALVRVVEKQVDANLATQHLKVTTTLDVDKALAMQPVEAARSRRALIATIVGGLFSTAAITALITAIASGKC